MRWFSLLIAYFSATLFAAAETYRCENPLFLVESASKEIAMRACRHATSAKDSLSLCGVHLSKGLRIEIVGSIDLANPSCLGLYHCGEERIQILSPEAMAKARESGGAFSDISHDALWDSVLVHELTHAAYQQVSCPFRSCIATNEYAAYAMQINSLPLNELERFGKQVALQIAPTHDAISELMYFMSPDRFAKLTWLHFSTRPDPCGYMEMIMKGNVFFDRERP